MADEPLGRIGSVRLYASAMSPMNAIGGYLGRVLVFNWIWALAVTVLSFVAQVL
jgi:hypothetical protein